MAITTYSELQTAAANWLSRADLTSRIPEFIALAEAKFNRDLRNRNMEQRAYATATEYMALPTDYLELRSIALQGTPRVPLKPLASERADMKYSASTSEPLYYEIIANQFRLIPAPDTTYTVEIDYFKSISALSASNTTNWLLTAYPDLYLYGTLLESAAYIQDDPRIPLWMDAFGKVFASANNMDKKQRWSGNPLVIRAA